MGTLPTRTDLGGVPFRLFLFGPLRLEYASQTIHLPTRKVELLLAYLALFPSAHSREKLASLFWGDTPDPLARGSLRKALTLLREHLGNSLLVADRETVQLNPEFPLWTDAQAFLSACQGGAYSRSDPNSLQSAVDLYRDDLLVEFYEDWIAPERDRFQTLYIELLLYLTQHLRAASEYLRATEFAVQVLARDPTNERAYQHLMFCYAAGGRRDLALKHYTECDRRLRQDLGVEPSPETRALYHWINQTPPQVDAVEARVTNLPIPLSSFIGRKSELSRVKQGIEQSRLVTLTGAGGSGKTRLAIQAATDRIDQFRDGVWWVELALLVDESLVPYQVAKALGIQESTNRSLNEMLIERLQSRQVLLVLDNCEHLITSTAQLVDELLRGCKNLRVLATSREALAIPGELVLRTGSLSVPDPQSSPANPWLSFDAIRLFGERAATTQPEFTLTDENAPTVAQICQLLDGIPLAIELAAARVQAMSLEQIAARLDDRFGLLTQGNRTAQPRQQTLRAAIDWSYDLLSNDEKILFQRLAVFVGGWTLEAAEGVCGEDGQRQPVWELQSRLATKSLVVVDSSEGTPRYRMLETIRQYAGEKLVESGEEPRVRDRHLGWFCGLAETAKDHFFGKASQVWLARLDQEHANLRAALEWSAGSADTERDRADQGLRLAVALWWFWELRGYLREGRAHLETLLERTRGMGETAARARALYVVGRLASQQGETDLKWQWLEAGLAMARSVGDQWTIGVALHDLGHLHERRGDLELAHSFHQESMRIAQDRADHWGIAWAWMGLGHLAIRRANYAEARACFEASLQIRREMGDRWGIGRSLNELGEAAQLQGDLADAKRFYEESLGIHREMGHKAFQAAGLLNLGSVNYQEGAYAQALARFAASLVLFGTLGEKGGMARALARLAQTAAVQGQFVRAARLLGAASSLQGDYVRDRVFVSGLDDYEQNAAAVRAQCGEALFSAAWNEGRKMTPEETTRFALETANLRPT